MTIDKRPVIYSAIFGGYDSAPDSPSKDQFAKYRFILLTDTIDHAPGWKIIKIESNNPALSNRECKMFPWKYFISRHSFYIDGHVSFGDNFEKLFTELIEGDAFFAVQKHRSGGNVGSELLRCIDNRKLSRAELQRIFDAHIDFTPRSVECGFIYRDSSSEKVIEHAENWWLLFNDVCPRDQLLVSQAAKNVGLEIMVIDSCFNDEAAFLKVGIHRNARGRNLKSRFFKALQIMKNGYLLDE